MAARTVVGFVFRRVVRENGESGASQMTREVSRRQRRIALDACVNDGLMFFGGDRKRARLSLFMYNHA